jgi:5-methylcytosine-specific restriction endonuclease McrA
MRIENYYHRAGFSPYYYAHIVFNLVRSQFAFLRNFEDIFGDMATSNWCEPFPKHTNLHQFIGQIVDSIFFEDPTGDGGEDHSLRDFCTHYKIDTTTIDWDDEEQLYDLRLWADYGVALDGLSDEVFHILFPDVVFCESFNSLIARYVPQYAESFGATDPRFTTYGRLRRVAVPQFVKKAVFHRDKGECRTCKKRLDRTLSVTLQEHYDHIVPLSAGGVNDLSNIQLLCDKCNLEKSSREIGVSKLYPRAFIPPL